MARVCGKVGLRTTTRALFVCGLETVGRPRVRETLGTITWDGWEGGIGNMSRVGWRAGLGTMSTAAWDGGLMTEGETRVKEGLGTLSRAGREGGSGKMARGVGRVLLGTVTRANCVGGLWNVSRLRMKVELGTITWDGRDGGRDRGYVPGGLEGRIRNYIYGCFGWWIGDCGRNACEVGIGDSIPGRLGGGIGENSTGEREGRIRDYN
jgi:hypothetical protein